MGVLTRATRSAFSASSPAMKASKLRARFACSPAMEPESSTTKRMSALSGTSTSWFQTPRNETMTGSKTYDWQPTSVTKSAAKSGRARTMASPLGGPVGRAAAEG